MLSKRMF